MIFTPRVACIGQRAVMDKHVQHCMMEIGTYLAVKGYRVSTGNADGADFFFAEGASHVRPESVELHLPWAQYNQAYIREGNIVIIDGNNEEYLKIAAATHPNWNACTKGAKALHARNVGIILGCTQVIAYPKMDGGKPVGGTAMGILLAQRFNIPVANIAIPSILETIMNKVNTM